ncbi:unnamed protein product [Rotaria sp. Silwood1]|nr:unnamed protein product [Rotaria sp. Silwood1]CAF3587103.1 unnamed protein product [Rotaria sp. Silwood1]CAF3596987.1 unnamed protein product [Rotaria sp. Silwood1]CAF4873844.1 unnamed protein product [Rotaria sp. Silwood1]CAF4981876.1 unnamed protein product [Rotaria sp. Silwood1]
MSENNSFSFARFDYSTVPSTAPSINPVSSSNAISPVEVSDIHDLIVNLKVKFNYPELHKFVDELQQLNDLMQINGKRVSILHLYALKSTCIPIDMSNQTVRTTYRPNLFVRKNDMYGPWNFKYLLDLLELEYECSMNNGQFPKLWKSTSTTTVQIKVTPCYDRSHSSIDNQEQSTTNSQDDVTLLDENIGTIEHLRGAVANETIWEKITVRVLVKQMIRDYVQLNVVSKNSSQVTDPYKESKATLLGDIHRVRRYFYHSTGQIQHVPYLDRNAVNLAIEEIRQTYDDDGNVLINIHNYLRTFCLQNTTATEEDRNKQREGWMKELKSLEENRSKLEINVKQLHNQLLAAERDTVLYEKRLFNILQAEKNVETEVQKMMDEAQKIALKNFQNMNWIEKREEAKLKLNEYQKKKQGAQKDLIDKRHVHEQAKHRYLLAATELDHDEKKIEALKELLELNLANEQRKLNVKFGRGLLLYGPPGTGKSELLKQAAIFAGITMTTNPLAAGELNRPYVGETEKLLIDIMSRADTILYLICAMTIDEIDGLVPKRDNNAQQSKVDGISVLLSHIEGVKNIPNLIVLGATNRRNMMDEAFLRRMQAKCFVGRPSPQIRKKMLRPLLSKGSNLFTNKQLDFLVKVTTNFSGAAVAALRSSIIVALDGKNSDTLPDVVLLELADNVAREFNCWFGVGTLPEICRMYPNLFNSQRDQNYEEYSLTLSQLLPSGRIMVDLRERKCLIELTNEPTLEKELQDNETSMLTLIARFVHGCSTRNIDTIQIIDLNFLTKQNAFDENQIFELLTTTFLECNEYNRSMLIFDIDSLIMLTVSDSEMSKSESISNIRLYQFIREKCKTAIVQQISSDKDIKMVKEKWIVIIVKHPLLRQLIIDDIEFKETAEQLQKEEDNKKKRIDDETEKVCPKCQQNYIPSKTNYGNCRYHDGFIYDLEGNNALSMDEAQSKLQKAKLRQQHASSEPPPQLIWACCLGVFGVDGPCRVGLCGLPEELKEQCGNASNQIEIVQEHFKKNQAALTKINKFLENFKKANTTFSNTSTPVRSSTNPSINKK